MADEKIDFDVKVMSDSWRKAIEISKALSSKSNIILEKSEMKDLAITFFNQSMKNISERLKEKKDKGNYGL